jgi:hypothetical protein
MSHDPEILYLEQNQWPLKNRRQSERRVQGEIDWSLYI